MNGLREVWHLKNVDKMSLIDRLDKINIMGVMDKIGEMGKMGEIGKMNEIDETNKKDNKEIISETDNENGREYKPEATSNMTAQGIRKPSLLLTCKKQLRRLLFIPAGLILYFSARLFPSYAEIVLARGLYHVYQTVMSFITGLLPFSLAELVVLAVVPFCLTVLIVFVVRLIRDKAARRERLIKGVLNLFGSLGIVFFLFEIGCGINYFRFNFSHYCGLTIEKSTSEDLYDLCLELSKRTNTAREAALAKGQCIEDENGVLRLAEDLSVLREASVDAMKALGDRYEVLDGYYPVPKPVMLSKGLSELNITGVFFPFTLEANVNIEIPDYSRGSVMCHELSHTQGFMREDEANYISYLACTGSGDAYLNYSGLMEALVISGNALYSDSRDLYSKLSSVYSVGVIRDLNDNSRYWDQYEDTAASEIGEKMNDTYLKANNQTDGTKSYGRMVDLLLAEYRQSKKRNP